ncbi:MAG: 4-demethylwyosine synthase TYW1 [Candidatus Altiarchaeota archaeon]|nr:4-demethylwyosine synthase TYW1 [Candidatus Altiarchaeota archaeon]
MPVKEFEKKGYRFFGQSAVQICSWNKKALLGKGVCYKQKFYGAPTNKCMQFSPAALFCTNNCIYCWRPAEYMDLPKEIDWSKPSEIIEHLIQARRKLLFGFKGNPEADKQLVLDSLEPTHFAISLSGEPTVYPHLPELIKLLLARSDCFSVFLVTNGQEPAMLEELASQSALPTQLYLSLTATDKDMYRQISAPVYSDAWERLNKSLELLAKLKTRTVLRITLIKNMNMADPMAWAKLIETSQADFVELKAYMHIGYSQKRMEHSNMPEFSEVLEFSKQIIQNLKSYKLEDQDESSRIVLLINKEKPVERFIKSKRPT